MFNNKRIKELEKRIRLLEYGKEFNIESTERRLFRLEYPNGLLDYDVHSDCYIFEYEYNKGIKIEYPHFKTPTNIEKLSDDKYLITIGINYFLVNTSTKQSIRVDKDMKVIVKED